MFDERNETELSSGGRINRYAATPHSFNDLRHAARGVRRVAMIALHSSPLAVLGKRQAGGMNVYVRELACRLARRQIIVDIFTGDEAQGCKRIVELEAGVRVVTLPVVLPTNDDESALAHIVDFAGRVIDFAASEAIAYDLVHSHYWLSGLAALELKQAWHTPIVQMFHTLGRMKNSVAPGATWRATEARLAGERRLLREADCIVAATPLEATQINREYAEVQRRTAIIPCGVDTEIFCPRDREAARARLKLNSSPAPLLLFVGRIEPLKNLDTLLHALRQMPPVRESDVRLVIVGGEATTDATAAPGDDRWRAEEARVRRLCADLGLGARVEFRAACPHDELSFYYNAADAVVVPSRYESFGLVALEAQSCGTPVIASRVGGLSFTVQANETGFLVEPDDAAGFSLCAVRLLADEQMRLRFGRGARENALKFAWNEIARRIAALYEQVSAQAAGAQLRGEPLRARSAQIF